MFSGKTTALIHRVEKYRAGTILAFKHAIDMRFGRDAIITHDGKEIPAMPVRTSRDILDQIGGAIELVAIDEAHFFELDLPTAITELNDSGIDVVLTSLEPDSWARPFAINELLRANACECIVKSAICAQCGRVADRTQRLTPIIDGNMVVDPSHYEPRCRACWQPPAAIST